MYVYPSLLVCVYVWVCVLTVVWLEQCYSFSDPHLSLRWQGALNNPAAVYMCVCACVCVCVCLCLCLCACTSVKLLGRGTLHVCGTVQPPVLFLVPWGDAVSQLSDNKGGKQTSPLTEWKMLLGYWMDPWRFGVRAHLTVRGLCRWAPC